VRVQLKNDDGSLCNPDIPDREYLVLLMAASRSWTARPCCPKRTRLRACRLLGCEPYVTACGLRSASHHDRAAVGLVSPGKTLYRKVAELVPKHPGRSKRAQAAAQAAKEKEEREARAASSAASGKSGKKGKKGRK